MHQATIALQYKVITCYETVDLCGHQQLCADGQQSIGLLSDAVLKICLVPLSRLLVIEAAWEFNSQIMRRYDFYDQSFQRKQCNGFNKNV